MSGLASLPDLSDEDWLAYQADTFRRDVRPVMEATQFRSAIQPILEQAQSQLSSAAVPLAEPEPIAPVQPAQPVPSEWDELGQPTMGGQDGVFQSAPLFGQQQVGPSALLDELGQLPEPQMRTAPPSLSSPGLDGGVAPSKPGFFSWAGEQVGRASDEMRRSGFSQTPVIGPVATGAVEAVEGTLHGLGGSAEALRRGDIGMGLLGTASTALNAVGDIPRQMATEAQWPEQIVPGISPDTPVLGGLNNPRELVGLATDVLLPETAVERAAGRLIGKAARPVGRAIAESPLGEAVSGAWDRYTTAPASGITVGPEGETAFHGTATPFDVVDPNRFDPDGLYGPGYYKSTDARLAESYTDDLRGLGQTGGFEGNAYDWSQAFSARMADVLNKSDDDLVGKGTWLRSRLDDLNDDLGQYGRITTDSAAYDPRSWLNVIDGRVTEAIDQDVGDLYSAFSRGEVPQAVHDEMSARLERLKWTLRSEAQNIAESFEIKPAPNIRKVNIPPGTQYLDINAPVPINEWQQIKNHLQSLVDRGELYPEELARFEKRVGDAQRQRIQGANLTQMRQPNFNDILGEDYYQALRQTFGSKKAANYELSQAGFDGVTHQGGLIMPLRGPDGSPILHQVYVTFPDKLDRIQNAISGAPGGIVSGGGATDGLGGLAARAMESPFFSPAKTGEEAAFDIAAGTAGGVAGAATADEDATWQERLSRGVAVGSLAAMLGPTARAPKGVGGLLREFARNEDGSLSLGAAARGRLNPPEGVSPEQWRNMSRAERRRENYARRRGEYAGRAAANTVPDFEGSAAEATKPLDAADVPKAAADNAYDEVYERQRDNGYGEADADETAYAAARQREWEVADEQSSGAERLYDDNPDYAPDESPTIKETADQAVARLTEDAEAQGIARVNPVMRRRQEAFTQGQEGLNEPGVGGALKQIADQTGSPAAGTEMQATMEQMSMWDMDELLDPDQALPKLRSGERADIERGQQVGAQDLPEVQDYVKRVTAAFRDDLLRAHGKQSDAALDEATRLLEPLALDIARTAEPGTGTSAVLVALMNRAVEATDTPAKLAYDRWRSAVKRGAPQEEVAALERNARGLMTINAIYRAGLEVYSSESGRALRANRADVYGSKPFIPTIAGGAVDSGDAARRDIKGTTPPRLKARERLEDIWRERERARRKGEADPVSGEGYSWDDLYWQEIRNVQLAGRSGVGSSGRSQGGALEREGLLWQDLFIRDDPALEGTGAKLTENERMRWLYGLEEMGIGTAKFDQFWDRLADINPDDTKAVLQFWNDAAKEGGATTALVPYQTTGRSGRVVTRSAKVEQTMTPWERGLTEAKNPLPDRIAQDWEGYLDAAETMTREKALDLAQRVLKGRLDNTEKALDEATKKGDRAGVRRYGQAAATARKDLNDPNGLYARIERQYPPSIKGESNRLMAERNRLLWEAEGKADGDAKQALLAQAGEAQAAAPGAWRRAQYQPGSPQGFYDDPAALVQKAQLLQQLDEVNRTAQLVRGGLSVATSNMLTSARMVEASALESMVMMANRVYTQWMWRGDTEGAKQLARGMWAGATPAWANMVQALKTGMGPMEAMDFLQDVARNQAPAIRSDAMRGKIGYLAPMHRISRGIQEFFTTIAYYGELNRLAHVESAGRAAGPTVQKLGEPARALGIAVTERTLPRADIAPETFFRNPTEAMRKAALQEAAEVASGGPHSAVAKLIANAKSKLETGEYGESGRAAGAVLNVFFPFVYGIDFSIRSGLKILGGPAWYGGRAVQAAAKGDVQAVKANATALGLTLAVDMFLFHQISQGNITGKGPSDPNQRQALLEAVDENGDPVWRPDSMRVPLPNGKHLWMNYTSLPVVGVTGAIMANMWDAYVWDGKRDMTPPERFATLAANTASAIAEGTFFRDTLDLASILTQPQSATTALSRFAGGLISRAVPGSAVLRQIAYASDPERKTPGNLAQEVMQGIPGLRGMVPEQVSPYTGGAVDMGYSWATPFAPGTVYYGQNEQNPLAAESLRLQRQGLNASPSAFSATQQGRGTEVFEQRQPGEVVRGLQSEIAQETGPRATALINSPQYQALSDRDKAAALEELFAGSRRNAEFAMKSVPGVQLSDQQRLEQAQRGVPRYYGVSGTPEEIDRKNREIGQAKTALAEYNRVYGPDMGEIMLRRVSPQAWRLAVIYEEVDPEIRWLRERSAARGAGLDPTLLAQAPAPGEVNGTAPMGLQFVTPDYVPNLLPPPQTSMANRLPPGARR